MVNHSRKLLNLLTTLLKISTNGGVRVFDLGWQGFKTAAMYFEPDIFQRVPEDEFRLQYRDFIRRLEQLSQAKGSMNLSSLKILGKLLDSKEKLCKDIEGPLSILARASVTQGVEAIVESGVSIMENHNDPTRGIINQDRLINELWVAINGPEVAHCESIVRESLKDLNTNFIRRDRDIKSYAVSKAVDSVVNKPARVPFLL